jgi:hypothetical protein
VSEEDLLKEIEWLRAELAATHAAIDRVRALHDYQFRGDRVCIVCRTGDATPMPYPCPTIRAIDGEAA